ncbi:MAG: molybdopterin-guanine dinucleotide biosynthesis protein B [Actinobacteria bacterium]|nr:molybdopterin-guanine dinucleotide biosynthesis protein B [Actinomycetota bacterium]
MNKFVISISGKSGSGKTTLLKKIIPILKKKGYKVGAIKHTHHDFEIDKRGKDSWVYRKAGAESVVITSKDRMAFVRELNNEVPAKEIIYQLFNDVDIILMEGYKKEDFPRIEVIGKNSKEEINKTFLNSSFLLMIVSEEPLDTFVPVYNPNKANKIADFIEEKMNSFYQNSY